MKPLLNYLKPHRCFLAVAMVLETLYLLVTPPLQSPDDFNHFLRAYQVSDGYIFADKRDHRVGGDIPQSFLQFYDCFEATTFIPQIKVTNREMKQAMKIPLNPSRKVFIDFPNTAFYSPVSYLPQAAGILIARSLHGSVGAVYYAGRVAVLVMWIVFMYFVIRMIPVFKWTFTLLILLPTSMYTSAYYSADNVTCMLSYFTIALVFRLALVDVEFEWRHFLIFLALGCGLALSKNIYVILLGLMFIIPKSKFNSATHKIFIIAAVAILSGIVSLGWADVVMDKVVPYAQYNPDYRDHLTLAKNSDFYKQKEMVMKDPAVLGTLMFNGIFSPSSIWAKTYIGGFGTYLDLWLPTWICIAMYVVILMTAIVEPRSYLTKFQKLITAATGIAGYAALVLAHHLSWNEVGSTKIDSLQGRYLAPLLPLFIMLLANRRRSIKIYAGFMVVPVAVTLNLLSLVLLYQRFARPAYNNVTELFFDMETVTGRGYIASDDHSIILDRRPSIGASKTGNVSLRIEKEAWKFLDLGPFKKGECLTCRFWYRGGTASLKIIDDQGNVACSGSGFRFEDEKGWRHVNFNHVFTKDEPDLDLLLVNEDHLPMYVDDFIIRMNRGKKQD